MIHIAELPSDSPNVSTASAQIAPPDSTEWLFRLETELVHGVFQEPGWLLHGPPPSPGGHAPLQPAAQGEDNKHRHEGGGLQPGLAGLHVHLYAHSVCYLLEVVFIFRILFICLRERERARMISGDRQREREKQVSCEQGGRNPGILNHIPQNRENTSPDLLHKTNKRHLLKLNENFLLEVQTV